MRTRIHRVGFAGLWLAVGILLAVPVLAQNPTGTLVGTVTDASGGALPGVTVSAESPNLQGTRTTQAGANGSYKLAFLPPGDYKVSYELEGFATSVRTVKINAAQTSISDIEMSLSEVVEEIVVTSNVETISQTRQVASTYSQDEIEKLAIGRDIVSSVNLTPGVHNTAPASGNAISISGAMSFENLWLVNGVVINENVRGEDLPLFIEDAVQETTTSVASISAEYGRFTGGVVNVITKSGGNQFSGSFRVNVDNEDWVSKTPLSGERADDTNEELEATLGGPFWKDHVWFFLAGRDREQTQTDQTVVTQITFPFTDSEERTEAKLTGSFNLGATSHSLIGSYLEIERVRDGTVFLNVLDLNSVNKNRLDPQEIKSANYTGILSANFFAEAQYSERELLIGINSGGVSPQSVDTDGVITGEDLIPGTMMRDRPTANRFWSPTFCGNCETEQRSNENTLAKGSYFLATEGAGTHDIVFGYDTFTDIRFSINHQSGSDFQVWADQTVIGPNNEIFPVFSGPRTWVVWWPPLNLDIAAPTDFDTNSFYVNDSWQLNENWSFNVGVRYDENDGTDSGGNTTVDDSKVSPRLGLTWDVKGDGDLVVNASYGTYVAAIANTQADSTSTGGQLGGYFMFYGLDQQGNFVGPTVNTNCQASGANCVGTADALATLYNWYFSNGGTLDLSDPVALNDQLPGLFYSSIPGVSSIVPDTLKSPSADELTIGVTKRLGAKGLARADLVLREWEDFYSNKTTIDIQRDASGNDLCPGCDLSHVGNFGDSILEREYWGLNLQARYRMTDRLTLAGNYTLSELEGNINGETPGSGPVPASPLVYPEYADPSWNLPVGDLTADQRHKVRMWAIYDLLNSEHHALNVSLLQSYLSGQPYGAVGAVASEDFVTNPGYQQPPDDSTLYWFTARDAFRTDDVTRTDFALNYSFRWNAFGKSMEVFLQPEVLNVFNEDAVVTPDQTILDATTGGCSRAGDCATFNPFTETPVEGVHWERGEDFGQADDEDDFQAPRTFRFSIGFRF